jgi:hypothetical protein
LCGKSNFPRRRNFGKLKVAMAKNARKSVMLEQFFNVTFKWRLLSLSGKRSRGHMDSQHHHPKKRHIPKQNDISLFESSVYPDFVPLPTKRPSHLVFLKKHY